jgi:hypothetical protein
MARVRTCRGSAQLSLAVIDRRTGTPRRAVNITAEGVVLMRPEIKLGDYTISGD